jgi:hypothetical protein
MSSDAHAVSSFELIHRWETASKVLGPLPGDVAVLQAGEALVRRVMELEAEVVRRRPGGGARRTDPRTSHRASASVRIRAGTQKAALLEAYAAHPDGLTDEQAGKASGLADRPHCCYWKRCSELRESGLIAVTDQVRTGSAGEKQRVCVITEAGRDLVAAWADEKSA